MPGSGARARRPATVVRRRARWCLIFSAGVLVALFWTATKPGPRPTLGPSIGPEIRLTANDPRLPRAQNSPTLIAHPIDESFVVLTNRWDAPIFNCALQISIDGGNRWFQANAVTQLPAGAEKCYAPEIGFDSAGTLHFLFVGLRGVGNTPMGVFLTSSTDRGQHFSAPRPVLGPNSFGVRMVIDAASGSSGRMHLVWLQANSEPGRGSLPPGPNPILSAHSDDGGQSFSEPVRVSDTDRQRAVAPALATGAGGTVYVLYYDLGADARDYQGLEGPTWEGQWSLVLSTSRDGGRHFGAGRLVDGGVVPPERVMLIFTMPSAAMVADRGGRVFVAWTDARNGDWDVLLRLL